jgi:hypothetical protein
MAWVRLDDGLPEHRKTLAAGGDAGWLHVCAIAYCNRNETDGVVPRTIIDRLSDRRTPSRLADRLVAVGLWEVHPEGWLIHDYLEFQPSKAKLADDRRKARERMAKNRGSSGDVQANDDGSSPYPDPSRPVTTTYSSSSVSTVIPFPEPDDDDFVQVVGIVLEGREREYATTIRNARAWRATVRKQIITEDGELIRKMLDAGDPPEQVAAFVLGFGMTSHHARDYAPIAWCDADCPVCDGDNFVYPDDPTVAHPCPNRVQRKEINR